MIASSTDIRAIHSALVARVTGDGPVLGSKIEYHAAIGSTNDRARELAEAGDPEGTIVLADEQTAGRGRGDRGWHSAAGRGVYLSTILRPRIDPSATPLFGLLAAVAVAEALRVLCGQPVHIKWPNDLVIPSTGEGLGVRKMAGILSEARIQRNAVREVILGIGINVDHVVGDFPVEIADRAVSIRMLIGKAPRREDVVVEVLERLNAWYTLWTTRGPQEVLSRYVDLAPELTGRRVRVTGSGPAWTGTTDGITNEGALRVRPDKTTKDGARDPVVIRFGELIRLEDS